MNGKSAQPWTRGITLSNKDKEMICDICGQEGARVRRMTEAFGKGKNMLIIENIPMTCCPSCGESYFTADTLHEIERIRLHRKSFAVARPVPVASFALVQDSGYWFPVEWYEETPKFKGKKSSPKWKKEKHMFLFLGGASKYLGAPLMKDFLSEGFNLLSFGRLPSE